jgi:hypothetical protein
MSTLKLSFKNRQLNRVRTGPNNSGSLFRIHFHFLIDSSGNNAKNGRGINMEVDISIYGTSINKGRIWPGTVHRKAAIFFVNLPRSFNLDDGGVNNGAFPVAVWGKD